VIGLLGVWLFCLLAAPGCQVDTEIIEGVTYVKVKAGMGIDTPSVPNALEAKFPAMHIRVVSPLLEKAASVALINSSGVMGWIIEGFKRGLQYFGLVARVEPSPLRFAVAKREPDDRMDHRLPAVPP